ncbi:hypothetical protein GBA52_009000 [Prunus armeniaca]|nr:hypothetical protein GBA52_009000 [Prunus armeniaca]
MLVEPFTRKNMNMRTTHQQQDCELKGFSSPTPFSFLIVCYITKVQRENNTTLNDDDAACEL